MENRLKVSIPKYKKLDGTVYYQIELESNPDGDTSWKVERRFNEFYSLNTELSKHFGSLPSIPGKTLFPLTSHDVLTMRREALQKYLKALVKRRDVYSNREFNSFLELDQNLQEVQIDSLKMISVARHAMFGFRDVVLLSNGSFFAAAGEMDVSLRIDSFIPASLNSILKQGDKAKTSSKPTGKAFGSAEYWKRSLDNTFIPYSCSWKATVGSQAICCSYSKNLNLFSVGLDNGSLLIYSLNSGDQEFEEIFAERIHKKRIMSIYLRKNTEDLVSISEDRNLSVFSIKKKMVKSGILNNNLKSLRYRVRSLHA